MRRIIQVWSMCRCADGALNPKIGEPGHGDFDAFGDLVDLMGSGGGAGEVKSEQWA
jgi:hypothetical protein